MRAYLKASCLLGFLMIMRVTSSRETLAPLRFESLKSYRVNVLNSLQGQRPKATDLSTWYGVYIGEPTYSD